MKLFRFLIYLFIAVHPAIFAHNNYDEKAEDYAKIDIKGQGTVFLSFRDIPELLDQFFLMQRNEISGVDYGCGAGRSTRFLKSIGINKIDGFDINQAMILGAKKFDPQGNYQLIESAQIPVKDNTYDLAFSSFVFVEVGEEEEIVRIFKEIGRVLKPGGIFIVVTPSEEAFDPAYQWLSYDIYAEDNHFKSGQLIKIKINEIDLELADYYWTHADFEKWSKQSDFVQLVKHQSLGKQSDEIDWASEWHVPPYTIYIFKKSHDGIYEKYSEFSSIFY